MALDGKVSESGGEMCELQVAGNALILEKINNTIKKCSRKRNGGQRWKQTSKGELVKKKLPYAEVRFLRSY